MPLPVSQIYDRISRGLQEGIHPGDLLELLDQLDDEGMEKLLELLSEVIA